MLSCSSSLDRFLIRLPKFIGQYGNAAHSVFLFYYVIHTYFIAKKFNIFKVLSFMSFIIVVMTLLFPVIGTR